MVLTGYTCLAVSVASMGLIMYANGDPDASLPLTAGFVGFAAVLGLLTVRLYRPLFSRRPVGIPATRTTRAAVE
ncbi:MAG TPA: hypothetical protein VE476_16325 [Propionibacteriaceae bacterium]|nr:hypothetical protein [Propionibacteriaceae bacterium]